jgi:ribosomal protein S18 acetylase RimI-like enzyme
MLSTDDVRLNHPVYAALTGAHSRFAQIRGRAVRYPPDVAPFLALPPDASASDWIDAAHLVPSGTYVGVQRSGPETPDGWSVLREFEVLQMVDVSVAGVEDPEAVALGPAHVSEMLELVRQTDPGPFLERTIELGNFVGIRQGGVLIAMAGERMHFDGWREISAVCTDPGHRGRGLAARLIGTLVCGVHRRQERAFLSVLNTNTSAIALYERLGFIIRTSRTLSVMAPTVRAG